MFGQKSRPVIGMLTGSLVSGNRSRLVDVATCPTSHLESKTPSPKGIRTFDVGGVGLGIVAALEKADDGRSEIPANKALFSWNLSRSDPIPITLWKNSSRNGGSSEHMEGYSTVTCHVPNKFYTKADCDGRRVNDRSPFRIKISSIKSNRASVFHISPARFGEDIRVSASNFLSSCHLCQKNLQGKDIYMYRGEKAFCSSECRYSQIVMDERKEKCSSEASRPIDVSSSPYANGQIFSTGILVI